MQKRRRSQSDSGSSSPPPADGASESPDLLRQHWLAVLLVSVALALIIAVALSWWQQERQRRRLRDTVIARRAHENPPEVAALLLEINDRVCDLVEKYPDSADALYVLGELHYEYGESDEAIQYWKKCLELDPEFQRAYESIGIAFREHGKHAEAAKFLREALRRSPNSAMLPVELAEALLALDRTDEAIQVLQEDLRRHPRSAASLLLVGQAYLSQKKYAEARKYFERAVDVRPDFSNTYFGLISACRNLGDRKAVEKYAALLKKTKAEEEIGHRKALQQYSQLGRARGQGAVVLAMAGDTYLAHGDTVGAESCLLRAIELWDQTVRAYELLAWMYVQQQRTADALAILDRLVQANPDSVPAAMTSGNLYTELGQYAKAEQSYKRVIQLTPHMAGPYAALASFYLRTRSKPQEALRLARRAVQLEPLARYYFVLCSACQANGLISEASQAIRKAVALDPGNVRYQKILQSFQSPQ